LSEVTAVQILCAPNTLIALALLAGGGLLIGCMPSPRARSTAYIRGINLLRTAFVVAAVIVAYPELFSIHHAPDRIELLRGQSAERLVLVSILGALVIACALPTRVPPVIITLMQGVLATAALFSAFTGWLGAGATTLWPGTSGALVIALLMHLSQSVSRRRIGALRASGSGRELLRSAPIIATLEMLVAAPTIWIYGYLVGLQIAI
jgi:hypothetical protein